MNWKFKRILTIVVGLVGGVLFLILGTKEFIHSKQLAARGRATWGEVSGLEGGAGRWSGGPHLEVRFRTEDQRLYKQRIGVTKTVYIESRIGDTVKIHYLPEDPSILQLGENVRLQYGGILSGFIFLACAAYMIVFHKRPPEIEKAAKDIGESFKTLTLEKYEYASVDARDFKHLDLAFYDELQRNLESRGFHYVDDQENVTLRQRNGIHTFIRYLLSRDKTTMADIFHFVPKFRMRVLGAKSAKVLDLETWFSDGSFVCTSNADLAGKLESPPAIAALHMPVETTWTILLETHERRVSKHRESRPGANPVALNGLADMQRAQAEMQRIKSEFRKRTGLTKAELERFDSGPHVDQIYDAMTERRDRGE